MKRILAIVLALGLILTLFAACGDKNTETETKAPDDTGDVTPVESDYVDPVNGWAVYDELIAQIKSETDYAKRTELMHQAEDILMSNYCVMPIYYYNDIYMQKDYVEGIYSNPFATKFWMYATLSNGSNTLRMNLASEPDYLDPALNSSVDGACLAANSFSGLYTYNAEGKCTPACAEGYTVSEDGLNYVVTLKDGLKWSDGSDLTAADFEFAWKRAVDPDTAADYEYMFSGFAGYAEGDLAVKATDDKTLEFSLIAPCAYIEDLMAFPTFYPVKASEVENDATPGAWCKEAGFISNGAYVCTEWNHGTSMTYEKNPYWYDADKVTVEKVEFMLSADDTAIYAAYEAGNIDFADSIPNSKIQTLIDEDNPEFYVVDELGTYYVAFNATSKLFEGKTPEQAAKMREALCILVDREFICETVGQTGQVPANSYIPLGMADGNGGSFKADAKDGYFDSSAISEDYDGTLEVARGLLEEAGFEFGEDGKLSADTPLKLNYLTNDGTAHVAVAEIIQSDYAELGIEMTISQMDWAVFLEERKNGNFDIAREGWIADFNDPINMLEMWITSSGNNDCQFGRFEGWDA